MSLSEAVAGFGAGIVCDSILYLPDNKKYLLQNNQQHLIRPITLKNLPWWYRGGVPVLFGSGLSYATFFYTYSASKTAIDPYIAGKDSTSVLFLSGLAGCLAIVPSTLVSFPFDTLKKHTAILPLTPSQVCHKIYRESGLKGFYFGLQYTFARDIYMSALKMGCFESMSKFCATSRTDPRYPQWLLDGELSKTHQPTVKTATLEASALTTKEVSLVGFLAGCIIPLLSMPLDCIVSRMRSPLTPPEVKRSWLTCAKWMAQQEQSYIKPFFRGTVIRTANYAVGSLVFWSLFTRLQHSFDSAFNKPPSLPH